jgi:hypothetical protein
MSKHKKSKGFNPSTFAIDNAMLSAGTMIGAGMVGKIGETLPSPVSGKIMGGMEPLAMLPTVHAAGGVFQSLDYLNRKVKKRR